MSKGVQIAGGATLIALLLGWYGVTNLEAGASFSYYETLTEFLEEGTTAGGHARVHGYVAEGSIERDVPQMRVGKGRVDARMRRAGEQDAQLRRTEPRRLTRQQDDDDVFLADKFGESCGHRLGHPQ